MEVFKVKNNKVQSVELKPFKLEKDIQNLVENNTESFFDLEFVCSEFSLKEFRIDTLCFDNENNSFVIIEYKKGSSYSVIDQGYSYLSMMLNNKSDFIIEYNEKLNRSLKRNDIDWSQSKIIFVSPSFNSYQKNSVNFADIPFELWEIKRFSDNTVVLNQQLAKSKESIKSVAEKNNNIIKIEGNSVETITGNTTKNISGDMTVTISGKQDTTIKKDNIITIFGNSNNTIKNNSNVNITDNYNENISGNKNITIKNNLHETITGNLNKIVTGTRDSTIIGNTNEAYSSNNVLTVKGNLTELITGTKTITVTGSVTEILKGNRNISIVGNLIETISGEHETTINGTSQSSITSSGNIKLETKTANKDIILKTTSGGRVHIENTDTILSNDGVTPLDTQGSLVVKGGAYVKKDMWVGENLNVVGNLNVFGNFTRLNTTNIVIDDPLIVLGLNASANQHTGFLNRYVDNSEYKFENWEKSINDLLNNKINIKHICKNSLSTAEKYSWKNRVNKIIKEFKKFSSK